MAMLAEENGMTDRSEVDRFRLFLRVVGHLARTIDQAVPPKPTLLELLIAEDPSTNWRQWLGLTPPKQRVADDHPHEEDNPYAPTCNMGDDL